MSFGDFLQAASLITLAITIYLSARQNKHAEAQSREATKQSAMAHNALAQSATQTFVVHGSGFLETLVNGDPELLSWYLASRGLAPASDEVNKRYLLMYLRMDVHEATYLTYLDRSLPEDLWRSWQRVIELDAATPEFLTMWPVVTDTYSARFAALVNQMIAKVPAPRAPS